MQVSTCLAYAPVFRRGSSRVDIDQGFASLAQMKEVRGFQLGGSLIEIMHEKIQMTG